MPRPRPPEDGRRELCGRAKPLSFRHLIPRKNHRKGRFRRLFSRHEMMSRGFHLCKDCHDGIHDLIPSERELGESYHTKERLLAREGFARHLAWVKKQKRAARRLDRPSVCHV